MKIQTKQSNQRKTVFHLWTKTIATHSIEYIRFDWIHNRPNETLLTCKLRKSESCSLWNVYSSSSGQADFQFLGKTDWKVNTDLICFEKRPFPYKRILNFGLNRPSVSQCSRCCHCCIVTVLMSKCFVMAKRIYICYILMQTLDKSPLISLMSLQPAGREMGSFTNMCI